MLATDEDGFVSVVSGVAFDYNRPSFPASVHCPLVAEPGIPFSCSFASIGGNADAGLTFDVTQTPHDGSSADTLGTGVLQCKCPAISIFVF